MGDRVTRQQQRFKELLARLAPGEGVNPARASGVRFMKSTRSNPRSPVIYDPSIIIVGQGRKIGHLGGEVYHYDPYNYLVLSVPLPFECETQASPQEPLLALSLSVDQAMLGELLLEMDETGPAEMIAPHRTVPRGIYSTPLTEDLLDAGVRLLECLGNDMDSRILAPQVVREIVFRVLQGEQGGALRALVAHNGSFSQIAKTLKRMHSDYATSLDVETLAREVGMSVSAFHHNFKSVTSASPLNYLKTLRLHKARMFMIQDGMNASTAAGRVGYGSASQFSREFKRFFGASPLEEVQKMRALLQIAEQASQQGPAELSPAP